MKNQCPKYIFPVPPGFTITPEACNVFLSSKGVFPDEMWHQVLNAVRMLEKATGKSFGDAENPLLVSCRSGAKFSMPGMMDTVLNIGLNETTTTGMIALTKDERFVYDSLRRLIQMYGSVVMGVPDELFEEKIAQVCREAGVQSDAELTSTQWKECGHWHPIDKGYRAFAEGDA